MMKTVCILVAAVSLWTTNAADPFWKDGRAPDLTRPPTSTSSYTCETAVEGRPYVEVVLTGVKFRTVLAPGFLLFLR